MIDAFLKCLSLLDRRNRLKLWLLGALIVFGSALEGLSVGIIFPVVKLIADPRAAETQSNLAFVFDRLPRLDHATLIIYAIAAVAALFAVKNLFLFVSLVWQSWFIRLNLAIVSRRLLKGYLLSPYGMHLQRNSSELIRNILESTPSLFTGILTNGVRAITEALIAVLILIILFLADPMAATVAMLVMGSGLVLFYGALRNRVKILGRQQMNHVEARLRNLQQSFGGIKEIKVLGREEFFARMFFRIQMGFTKVMVWIGALSELPRLAFETLIVFVIAFVVILNVSAEGTNADLFAVLGLFGAAAFRLMPSVNRLLAAMQNIRQAMPNIDWIYDDFQTFANIDLDDRPPQGNGERIAFKSLSLEGVSFRYPNRTEAVLSDIDLTISQGETVALVGSSGAGKTTLADILLGLHPPTSGQVKINGAAFDTSAAAWHELFGYVPQSIYLLDDTMKRNVALGLADGEIDELQVLNALKKAQLADFADSLPQGVETVLGEQGTRLSGGQRQRVGIARALYHDPQILVLDEATSSLDSETEHAFNQAIESISREKTIIVIAHRLSTVRHCDRIIFLEQGRIADVGSFHELLSQNSRFRRLVELGQLDLSDVPTRAAP